jgi:very-short-patch-repair endonuclease
MGLPSVELQVEIRDERGGFVARVDFLFHQARTVVEFDGLVKYGGAGGRQALIDEKRREDSLRSLGYQVVRLTWRELYDLALVERSIRKALTRA